MLHTNSFMVTTLKMTHANSDMVTTLKMTIKLKGVDTNNQCHNVYAKVVISDYVHTC